MLLFAIWFHSGLFYSYPTLSCWFYSSNMKTVKELLFVVYGKMIGREDRSPRYLLYFAFISGFNNHSVGVEIIPEYK